MTTHCITFCNYSHSQFPKFSGYILYLLNCPQWPTKTYIFPLLPTGLDNTIILQQIANPTIPYHKIGLIGRTNIQHIWNLYKKYIAPNLVIASKRFSQRQTPTMNTSNSSRHRNGDSIASHNESTKQTVEKDRSPPDRDLKSLVFFCCEVVCTYMSKTIITLNLILIQSM